jgi:hypothetical protein
MITQDRARRLLEEWYLCSQAKPKSHAMDIQIDKDNCMIWVHHLSTIKFWGTDTELAEVCCQLESRLKSLKEKIIIEVLTNGSV